MAVASFKKATELKPDYPEAWNELGYALRNVGNYPDSVKAYDEALRLKPRFPEALEYLGEAYVKMGQVGGGAEGAGAPPAPGSRSAPRSWPTRSPRRSSRAG